MLVLLSKAAVESSYWDEFGEHCMQAPWSLDSSSSNCRCLSGSPSEHQACRLHASRPECFVLHSLPPLGFVPGGTNLA